MSAHPQNLATYLATNEWEVLVNHRCDLLTEHMIYTACVKYVRLKELGFSFDHPDSIFDSESGNIWWKTLQIQELEEQLLSPKTYADLTKRLQAAFDEHRAYLAEFKEKRHKAPRDLAIIDEFFERSQKTAATIFYFQLEKGAHKHLERQGIPGHIVRSSLTDTTRAAQELKAVASAHADEFTSNATSSSALSPELTDKLRRFVERFGYLAMKYFQGHPWTIWEAYEMAKTALLHPVSDGADSKAKSASPYVQFLEDMLRLRTEKWELMCYGASLFREMVLQHFSHLVHYDDLLSLNLDEARSVFHSQFPARKLLEDRKRFLISSIHYEVAIWTEPPTAIATRPCSDIKELKGVTAQPGKVTGRVKVVMSPREASKVEEGDILVATMSTPDFLPAMMRAAAFVTDIGGITSHAALVSREMKKPCIIATKVATQVFQDGDLIEVDAETGIVRKV